MNFKDIKSVFLKQGPATEESLERFRKEWIASQSLRSNFYDSKSKYIINTHDSQPSITCLTCHRTSYSPGDIENKYCGYCHKFHV